MSGSYEICGLQTFRLIAFAEESKVLHTEKKEVSYEKKRRI